MTVEVGAHPEHGSLIAIGVEGVAEAERVALARRIDERLDPLVLKHELSWC
jgi:hypothetical protein